MARERTTPGRVKQTSRRVLNTLIFTAGGDDLPGFFPPQKNSRFLAPTANNTGVEC
jgi:hypothetical protein